MALQPFDNLLVAGHVLCGVFLCLKQILIPFIVNIFLSVSAPG